MMRALAAPLLLVGAVCFGQGRAAAPPDDAVADFHSYANFDQYVTTHMELVLDVDFAARQLLGGVMLEMKRLDPRATQLVLDTKDLNILAVTELTADIVGATEKPAPIWVSRPFHLGKADPILGSPLIIDLPPSRESAIAVRIEYKTSPQARGLQWSVPAKSNRKRAPFLYSMSEPINARSWIPLQDTPQVRATYRAHVHTPDNLVVLMSASNDPKIQRSGQYWFVMSRPIPASLIALAVGDLRFKATGARTGVYAEGSVAAAAVKEFGDAEAMLQAAEKLLGTYHWERYDLVVMPPSFPVTDADNPRLSFISPTVLAGDQSFVATIAYALAYSWSGELVTNAGWRDRWVGQAIAGYLADRIVAAVYGGRRVPGRLPGQDTGVLASDLQGMEYDDLFDPVSREKGRQFFSYLETKFGRAHLDAFLRGYFERRAWQSVTTEQFVSELQENLLDRYPGIVTQQEIASWVFDLRVTGDQALLEEPEAAPIDAARSVWMSGGIKALPRQAREWTTPQWQYFLDGMAAGLGAARLAELDQAFALSSSRNAQIAACWFALAIREGYLNAFKGLAGYLRTTGRLTLIEPLYAQLMKSDDGVTFARRVYAQARPGYHPFVARRIDAIVGP
jgi:leukotriene-A4 hydrolase